MHLSVGSFEHLLVIADQRIERRGDELFCCDGIHEEQQPGSKRFDRRHRPSKLLFRRGYLFQLRPINRL